jgi:hypothetical protein
LAYIAPSDVTHLALAGRSSPELATLGLLKKFLPPSYWVFHNVHWSRESQSVAVFGEADFIVLNGAGAALVIEQKNSQLLEEPGLLVKRYGDENKDVVRQLHRTLDGIREKFKRLNDRSIQLDYLIYCPDHRLRAINAAGLDTSRVVDASGAEDLTRRICELLPPSEPAP